MISHKQVYSFPPVKDNEIIQCMAELNIPITLDELADPMKHKDHWYYYYQHHNYYHLIYYYYYYYY